MEENVTSVLSERGTVQVYYLNDGYTWIYDQVSSIHISKKIKCKFFIIILPNLNQWSPIYGEFNIIWVAYFALSDNNYEHCFICGY